MKSYTLKTEETSLSANLQDLNTGIYNYTLYVNEEPVATKKLSVVK